MKTIIHKMRSILMKKTVEQIDAGFACPICHATHVHSHTSGEIVEYRNKLKAELAPKVSQPNTSPKRKPAPKKDVPGEVVTAPQARKRKPRNNNHGR
jgi:hypothetical protein